MRSGQSEFICVGTSLSPALISIYSKDSRLTLFLPQSHLQLMSKTCSGTSCPCSLSLSLSFSVLQTIKQMQVSAGRLQLRRERTKYVCVYYVLSKFRALLLERCTYYYRNIIHSLTHSLTLSLSLSLSHWSFAWAAFFISLLSTLHLILEMHSTWVHIHIQQK